MMHKLLSSFVSSPDVKTTTTAAGPDDAQRLREELRRWKKKYAALSETHEDLQKHHVDLEESSKQLKEDYEALQLENSELKAAYFELKEGTNDLKEFAKKTNTGFLPPDDDERAEGKASRHYEDEDDYFEFVDAVEEKLIPDDDADYFSAKCTLNQTI